MDVNKSKMYILIKGSVDLGHAILSSAHASLGGYLTWEDRAEHDDEDFIPMDTWASQSFRKVVCKVTDEEFEEAKSHGVVGRDYRIMTESGLDNAEISIVFRPREHWNEFFKKLRLYK